MPVFFPLPDACRTAAFLSFFSFHSFIWFFLTWCLYLLFFRHKLYSVNVMPVYSFFLTILLLNLMLKTAASIKKKAYLFLFNLMPAYLHTYTWFHILFIYLLLPLPDACGILQQREYGIISVLFPSFNLMPVFIS